MQNILESKYVQKQVQNDFKIRENFDVLFNTSSDFKELQIREETHKGKYKLRMKDIGMESQEK